VDTVKRWLMLGALPLIGVLYAGSVAIRPVASTELLAATTSNAACTQPPVFKPGYQRAENFVIPQGQGFRFRSESWLEADVCAAGTLKITAQGELGGDELPQLTVALDSAVIATPSFDRERTVELRIPRPGRVYLAYFNDYHLADVRVASLRFFRLVTPSCRGFKSVVVPKENGGAWYPAANAATLVRDVPMTLVLCSAGTLSLEVKGREGNRSFPRISIEQGGRILKTLPTTLDWQTVRLESTAAPLTITLSNPYGRTLADRNLDVQQILFDTDVR
jgi:hypothetical protein